MKDKDGWPEPNSGKAKTIIVDVPIDFEEKHVYGQQSFKNFGQFSQKMEGKVRGVSPNVMDELLSQHHRAHARQMAAELDKIMIEGLRLKGYEFGTTDELANFIVENCDCLIDPENSNLMVYRVKEQPFLLFEKTEPNVQWQAQADMTEETVIMGRYEFL